jgi:hypothetical protein
MVNKQLTIMKLRSNQKADVTRSLPSKFQLFFNRNIYNAEKEVPEDSAVMSELL